MKNAISICRMFRCLPAGLRRATDPFRAVTLFELGLLLSLLLTGPGCNDSKRGDNRVPERPAKETGNGPSLSSTVEPTSTGAPTNLTTDEAQFYPIPLDQFYQRLFTAYRPTDSWALVPRGVTSFDGVPFRMFGKIDLAGLGRARDGEFQPARVGEIPVNRRAARVHVVHGASYDCPDNTPVSCLLLHYNHGEARRLFIRYGVQVRNWYRERSESNSQLADPQSRVIWTGNSRPDGTGTPTRLFKTTFDNPLPGEEIRGIELLSLFARANSVILAITLEESLGSPAAPAPASGDNDDSEFRREASLRIVDADSSQPVPQVAMALSVVEAARKYRFGAYTGDAQGRIRIDYPPGKFQALNVEMSAPGYPQVNFAIESTDGLFGPDLPVRLKREGAP